MERQRDALSLFQRELGGSFNEDQGFLQTGWPASSDMDHKKKITRNTGQLLLSCVEGASRAKHVHTINN